MNKHKNHLYKLLPAAMEETVKLYHAWLGYLLTLCKADTLRVKASDITSALDTFSCTAQGVIPYGAQILVAVSAAAEMGCVVSAFDLLPKLYYPALLLVCSLIAIFLPVKRKKA